MLLYYPLLTNLVHRSPNGEPGSLQLMLNYNDVNNTTTTATMPTGDATPWRVLYDNDLTFYYAILTSIMSALFTGFWKRRANHLSYLWATASTTKEPLTRRHEFRPTSTFVSPITGLVEPQFPRSRRMLRHFLSWIVLILFLVVICASVFAQFIVGKEYVVVYMTCK